MGVLPGVCLVAGAQPAHSKNAVLELRYIYMRTSAEKQMQRTSEFLQKGALPALQRAGAGPIGVFSSVIAPESPFLLVVSSFADLAAMDTVREKEAHDPEYLKARDAYNSMPGQGFVRIESSLLRTFDGMPTVAVPAGDEKRVAKIFELRMYESDNASTLARKVKMFNDGEIGIFKRLGMQPVFFGETIVGAKMPNLVYMLSFDDLAARERLWRAFGSDPEWRKLRSQPGAADAEIVSHISNSILQPAPFSAIR
jgi:hypothetical protein